MIAAVNATRPRGNRHAGGALPITQAIITISKAEDQFGS